MNPCGGEKKREEEKKSKSEKEKKKEAVETDFLLFFFSGHHLTETKTLFLPPKSPTSPPPHHTHTNKFPKPILPSHLIPFRVLPAYLFVLVRNVAPKTRKMVFWGNINDGGSDLEKNQNHNLDDEIDT